MSIYDKIFRPKTFTISNGKSVSQKRSRAPLEFMKTLPLQHPYGFPCAVKCVLTDEEAHDH